MPIKKSAQKALRQTKKRTARNAAVKIKFRRIVKDLERKIASKDKSGMRELMPKAAKVLDKAVKNHILTKNAAARKKSRLQKAINKIG